MTRRSKAGTTVLVFIIACLQPFGPAHGGIVLSELILDLQPGRQIREDVEVWNDGSERTYVALEAREIVNPGTPGETSRKDRDPEQLGLLVSPARMILEPGQRKLARVAVISTDHARERVFRVTVKPAVGPITSNSSGLKVLVGYDVLVLVRPAEVHTSVTGKRVGKDLFLQNDGNSSVELLEGSQCEPASKRCVRLPSKRLYAGATLTQTLPITGSVTYTVKSIEGARRVEF